MDATLMCALLGHAAANEGGKLALPDETAADPAVAAVLGFLVEQCWLEEEAVRTWTVTPAGRFWFQSLHRRDLLIFHEYGGAVFLLHLRSRSRETVVWHEGRFATITIESTPRPEHFEVRRENEPTTTPAGVQMQEALAVACRLLAENLEEPQPLQPVELRLHMLRYIEQL